MSIPRSGPFALPMMFAELAAASWETVWHRGALIATGACTIAEYKRMVQEKMQAVQMSSVALMTGQDSETILRPFHARATANAVRLRG